MFQWAAFLTYVVIGAITPGPNNIMSLSNGRLAGFRKAVRFNVGIFFGSGMVSLLCIVFCSFLNTLIPKIQLPMTILGALYILYLAWMTFRSNGEIEEKQTFYGFWAGMLLQFVNPKVYICTILAVEAYILPVYQGQYLILTGFGLLLGFIGLLCTTCWTAFGAAFQRILSRHGKAINTILALLLVYCAASLFFT